MIQNKNILSSWFSRGRKPLAGQFADWLDSFWHKQENIPATAIDGLSNVLDEKVSRSGDVMNGNLAIPAGTEASHAINKSQMDTVVNNTNTALNTKVSKSGDTMSGNLAIPAGTEASHAVNKSQMEIAIAALVDSSPEALNTLNELANALGDDPNFATTVSNEIGEKVSKAGDTITGNLTVPNGSAEGHAVNKGQLDAAIIANQQVNADWSATSGKAAINNKPVLATVATSGSYNDLINKPNITINQGSWINLRRENDVFNHQRTCRVRKIGSVVYLDGHLQCPTVKIASSNLWDKFIILPEGYRPNSPVIRGGMINGIVDSNLLIDSDGGIRLFGSSPSRFFDIYLGGIIFFVD